jgi:hypothetical protein
MVDINASLLEAKDRAKIEGENRRGDTECPRQQSIAQPLFLSSSKALINNQVRHRPDIEQRHSRIIAGEIAGTDVINRILPLVLAVLQMYHRQSGQEQTLGQLPIVDRLRTMGPEA